MSALILQVKGICNLESYVLLNGPQANLQVPKELSKDVILMSLPQMFLKFRTEGVTLEITEYFRRCTSDQPEQWCSIISTSKELSDNEIVLGTAFIKDYYFIIDKKMSRVGLAKKRTQQCHSTVDTQPESIYEIHGNDTVRFVFNIAYLLTGLYLLLKASQGCMSFYDFSFETLYSCFKKKGRSDD